jgi:predicted Zn-dependent protease
MVEDNKGFRSRGLALLATTALAALLVACASVDSSPDAPSVAQQDVARAAQQHPQIMAEFGGEVTGPVSDYVKAVGEKTAAAAGVPGRCTFTVVNTDVVNAFAVPGCYIYVTRGLMAIMNSEDELASVLGHEAGHVTADHSAQRQNRSILTQLGALAVGVALGSNEALQAAGQLAQMYTLNYSRDQEFESDFLGVRYLQANGYNLFAAGDMLGALGTQEQLEARVNDRPARSIPSWARSHPLSADRVARVNAQAQAAGATREAPAEQVRPYFAAINGMLYADDPEQGFIDGQTFAHPTLRLAFDTPQGFTMANTPRAVNISGTGNIRAQFTGGAALQSGGLGAYANAAMRTLVGQTPAQVGAPEATTINGIQAISIVARAQNAQGQVTEAAIVAYDFGGRAFHFQIIGPGGQLGPTLPMIRSMRRLSNQDVAQLRPRQIEIVEVRRGDTVNSLAARMAYSTFQVDRFLAINGLQAGAQLVPGQQVKVIRYGAARTASRWPERSGLQGLVQLADLGAPSVIEQAMTRHDHEGDDDHAGQDHAAHSH